MTIKTNLKTFGWKNFWLFYDNYFMTWPLVALIWIKFPMVYHMYLKKCILHYSKLLCPREACRPWIMMMLSNVLQRKTSILYPEFQTDFKNCHQPILCKSEDTLSHISSSLWGKNDSSVIGKYDVTVWRQIGHVWWICWKQVLQTHAWRHGRETRVTGFEWQMTQSSFIIEFSALAAALSEAFSAPWTPDIYSFYEINFKRYTTHEKTWYTHFSILNKMSHEKLQKCLKAYLVPSMDKYFHSTSPYNSLALRAALIEKQRK